MNRRELVKGMLALPAAGVLGGWEQYKPATSSGNKLVVVLHGPWAVVVQKNKGYHVNAFVPKTSADDKFSHEFRFLSPGRDPALNCDLGHRFELRHEGLEPGGNEPLIHRGLDNVRLSIEKWEPDVDDHFVSVELPPPAAISYVPPLYPVTFASEDPEGRPGYAPLNHVLEYWINDPDSVSMHRKPSHGCQKKGEKEHHPPLSSKKLLEEYENYHSTTPDHAADPTLSQRRYIARLLQRSSHAFFFGVGVRPEHTTPKLMPDLMAHGISFFNDRLIPSVLGHTRQLPYELKLQKIGRDALPCGNGQSPSSSPSATSVAWRQQYLPITSTENCTSPALTAVVHGG